MQSQLPIPAWSQRNPQWASQRLGTVDGTTIGGQGCLITCIAMMNAGFDPDHVLNPANVDDVFTNNAGYATGNLVVWNAINRLLPNCATGGAIYCTDSPAPVGDLRAHLDSGQLAILQVGFGGNPKNMHFLLALGYNGDDIVFNDPWYGDRASFQSGRYGTGQSARDILAIHYFADGITPVKPPVPVAARPVEQPLLGYQRVVAPTASCNYRTMPNVTSEVIKRFDPGTVLDFRGYVHGEVVDGVDVWFMGRYSGGYAHASCFTDPYVHDLEDLAPASPQPTPEPPAPVVTPDPTPSPQPSPPVEKPEWERTWSIETITPKVVAVPSADVFDFLSNKVVKTLPGGEPVAQIGGKFSVGGREYIRTQWSVDHGKWNGIALSDLKDLEIPIPITVVPPTPTTNDVTPPEPTGLDAPAFPEVPPLPESAPLSDKDLLKKLWAFILSLLLSPLRLVGIVNNLRKGIK